MDPPYGGLSVDRGRAGAILINIDDDDGGTDHYIYKSQPLAANATFEHTSKIVLNAGDMLGFITGGAADVDVVVNYLEQTL